MASGVIPWLTVQKKLPQRGDKPAAVCMRPTLDDWELIDLLRKKLGVEYSQLVRLGLRALAAKENVAA